MTIRCSADRAQALMIDMQKKLMPAMSRREDITGRTGFLLKALDILGVPLTISQQYTRGLGMTEDELLAAAGAKDYLDKVTFSCLRDEALKEKLMAGPEVVLVFGVEAHICVMQTVLDLLDAGKKVVLICDCTDSRNRYDAEIAFRRMEQAGAVLGTSEMVIYEMMERAGGDVFRSVSALVKETPLFPG